MKDKKKNTSEIHTERGAREPNQKEPPEEKVYRVLKQLAGKSNFVRIALARLAKLVEISRQETTMGVIKLFLKKRITYKLSFNPKNPSQFVLNESSKKSSLKSCEGKEGGYRGENRENAQRYAFRSPRNAALNNNKNNSSASVTSGASVEPGDEKKRNDAQGERVRERGKQPLKASCEKSLTEDPATLKPGSSAAAPQREKSSSEQEDYLAEKIAGLFSEPEKVGLYEHYLSRYGRKAVLEAVKSARAIPEEHLRTSRAALFTYLLKRHEQEKLQQE